MLSDAGKRSLPAANAAMESTERCPRCFSDNTKFCYYNNYNLAQPRHFCKACRRYWTLGGALRNVPIGGSTRSTTHPHPKPPHSPPTAPGIASKRPRRRPHPSPVSASPSPPSLPPSLPPLTPLRFDTALSASPKVETSGTVVERMDMVGSFVSLLTEPLRPGGILALGGQFLLQGHDHGFELALGPGGDPKWIGDEMGFAMARPAPAWSNWFVEEEEEAAGLPGGGEPGDEGPGGISCKGDASPVATREAELVGGVSGDWFGWPELAIPATSGKGLWHSATMG